MRARTENGVENEDADAFWPHGQDNRQCLLPSLFLPKGLKLGHLIDWGVRNVHRNRSTALDLVYNKKCAKSEFLLTSRH
jgi:hypothetical protein